MTASTDGEARVAEVHARLRDLRALLDGRGDGAALLTTRRNVAWLTAGATAHVLESAETAIVGLLVTRDDMIAITQNIEAARLADEEFAGLDVEVAAVPWWEPGAIEAEAGRRLPAGQQPARDDALESELVPIRSVLSAFDRERLALLGRTAARAVDAAFEAIRPGRTEEELAADLSSRLPGVRAPVVLIAADERIARYRHPLPGTTPIRSRVMLVLVAERFGLHVALTRIRELAPPGAELARRIQSVAAVQAAMHQATRPGTTFADVFEVARRAYTDAGFPDEWRDHHQGGSIGYQARERIAVPGDETVIRPGMAFAWNPSIAGAKAEDTIVVHDAGHEVLTGT